jgi:hypothetical protein
MPHGPDGLGELRVRLLARHPQVGEIVRLADRHDEIDLVYPMTFSVRNAAISSAV